MDFNCGLLLILIARIQLSFGRRGGQFLAHMWTVLYVIFGGINEITRQCLILYRWAVFFRRELWFLEIGECISGFRTDFSHRPRAYKTSWAGQCSPALVRKCRFIGRSDVSVIIGPWTPANRLVVECLCVLRAESMMSPFVWVF